jgi:hypothetical protein
LNRFSLREAVPSLAPLSNDVAQSPQEPSVDNALDMDNNVALDEYRRKVSTAFGSNNAGVNAVDKRHCNAALA